MITEDLRPKTIDEIIGQEHLLGPGKPIRKLLETDKLTSFILYGPPGTGKTTIASVIAKHTKSKFVNLNATAATVKNIRDEGNKAKTAKESTILFIDEIHRFSKTQQDALLPYIEQGQIIFIGATTENPHHSINSPLISRSQVFTLEPLTEKHLLLIFKHGLEYIRKTRETTIEVPAIKHIIRISCGDGRKVLSTLHLVTQLTEEKNITLDMVQTVVPNKYTVLTDDLHFDCASAYQGSIQHSDPDAAIYWLAKWLESGEDPRYIARRLLVSAAEDAAGNPICTAVAHAAYTAACEIGRPECDIVLAQATVMVASSPRDKSAAKAIWSAVKDVRDGADVQIPKAMKDSHYIGASNLGHGKYHDGMNQWAYVGVNKKYYFPNKDIS